MKKRNYFVYKYVCIHCESESTLETDKEITKRPKCPKCKKLMKLIE